VEEVIALAGQTAGPAVGAHAAVAAEGERQIIAVAHLRLDVVVDIAGDKEIELAIAVVVAPGAPVDPVAESDAGLLGYVVKVPSWLLW